MAIPAPKDPSERRRRNVPERGEWVDITTERLPDDQVILPPLPERWYEHPKTGEKIHQPWSDQAKRAWEAWSRDPVSVYWSEGDIETAWQTIELIDNGSHRLAPEIRQRMTALALTPAGKRNLRFRVTPKFEVGHEAPRVKPVKDELDERRKRLSHGA